MKTLRKLLWIQLFLLTVLFTTSLLVKVLPQEANASVTADKDLTTVSDR